MREKKGPSLLSHRSFQYIPILVLIISFSNSLFYVHAFTPNDPVGDPWHLEAIKIHSVWDHGYSFYTVDAIGLCVSGDAIIDDQNGDLNVTAKASFALNGDFSSYIPYTDTETSSHEGAVASVAASTINNGIGIAGIVNAPLYSAWLWGNYPDDDASMYRLYAQQMIDMFDWGASFGKMVFTMSYLAYVDALEHDDSILIELRNKVAELYEGGNALFFAAVGNTLFPLQPNDVPQSLPHVHGVGRVDSSGAYVEGGYGEQVFLVAPAGGIPAYMQTSQLYGLFGGASCSTPIVAASAVLLWNQFPWATNDQIEDALCWSATDMLESGWDEKSGYGALNIERAREYLAEYVPSANSYHLNRTDINSTLPLDDDSTNSTTSAASMVPVILSVSIPLTGCIIVSVIVLKRKR